MDVQRYEQATVGDFSIVIHHLQVDERDEWNFSLFANRIPDYRERPRRYHEMLHMGRTAIQRQYGDPSVCTMQRTIDGQRLREWINEFHQLGVYDLDTADALYNQTLAVAATIS